MGRLVSSMSAFGPLATSRAAAAKSWISKQISLMLRDKDGANSRVLPKSTRKFDVEGISALSRLRFTGIYHHLDGFMNHPFIIHHLTIV